MPPESEPFPGLDTYTRTYLCATTRDWSGRGVDPDRDLWEAALEYPDLRVALGTVSVTTPPIAIEWDGERIEFGSFHLETRVQSPSPASVTCQAVALRPNLRRSQAGGVYVEYCHPHVSASGFLCLGQAHQSYAIAQREGRWADCFDLAQAVLRTQGSDPHKHVRYWSSRYVVCEACGIIRPKKAWGSCDCQAIDCGGES